jgi:hypothetical protein
MTAVKEQDVEAMIPISLQELVESAELLTRVDRKYVIPVRELRPLMGCLQHSARILDISGLREFGYRSTYYDTPHRDSFLTSGRSRRRRWKVRTRTYLDSGRSWLEVKTRQSRDQTVKQRTEYVHADEDATLSAEGTGFVTELLGADIADALEPVLVTGYRRTTLYLPASHSRVTIDVDLGWTSLTGRGDLNRPSIAILETKTGSTPSEVDRLMWSRGHRPARISKYGVGMAALDPALPRLKWNRSLQRHLGLPAIQTGEAS